MIKLPSRNAMILNGVAGAIILLGAFSMARAIVSKPVVPTCTQRLETYARSTTLSLEREGELIRLAEFQSDFGGRDFGIADHLQIRGLSQGPAKATMAVSLGKGSSFPKSATGALGGVSFPWTPEELDGKKSVCLVYHVFLPVDFAFGAGGSLPGIVGGLKERAEDGSLTEYTTRTIWRQDGELALLGVKVERNQRKVDPFMARNGGLKLQRGKWIEIQQEFVPNEPNMPTGTLRLWMNGQLAIDKTEVNFLREPGQVLQGVSADIHFGNEMSDQPSPQDQKVYVTPLQLFIAE